MHLKRIRSAVKFAQMCIIARATNNELHFLAAAPGVSRLSTLTIPMLPYNRHRLSFNSIKPISLCFQNAYSVSLVLRVQTLSCSSYVTRYFHPIAARCGGSIESRNRSNGRSAESMRLIFFVVKQGRRIPQCNRVY